MNSSPKGGQKRPDIDRHTTARSAPDGQRSGKRTKYQPDRGFPPDGQPVRAQTPRGQAPRGQAPRGQAPRGQAPQGQMLRGQAPRGQVPQGQAPRGQVPQGQATRGQMPQGQVPQGQMPQGQVPQGQMPQGQVPQGQMPQGRSGAVVRQDSRPLSGKKQPAQVRRPKNTTVSSRARTQTPANRRAERERRRIDPRQIEINRRRREMHKFYVRRKRKNAVKVFLGRALIFLIMFAIIFSAACGITMLRFYSFKAPGGGEITYQIGADEDDDRIVRRLDYSAVIRDGCVYINITEIALLCEFTTTGDLNEIKLISKNESNDNVKLTMDSPVIYINTLPVRLQAPVYKSGESVYIPLGFISDYVTGISAEYDAANAKITIMREIESYTVATFTAPSVPVYSDVCFTLKKPVTTDSIPEDSLDEDIRIATEPQPADTGDTTQ